MIKPLSVVEKTGNYIFKAIIQLRVRTNENRLEPKASCAHAGGKPDICLTGRFGWKPQKGKERKCDSNSPSARAKAVSRHRIKVKVGKRLMTGDLQE